MADKFHAEVQARFADTIGVKISDIYPEAVAPHPMPQFEIAFTKYCLQDTAPWLIFNRPDKYSILVHPFTSDVVRQCWHTNCVMQKALPRDMIKVQLSGCQLSSSRIYIGVVHWL